MKEPETNPHLGVAVLKIVDNQHGEG